MNENHKNEIEELLSDLVDEQAGDRQKTEFKRLVAHDPGLIDQLAAMQRQRDILNALPVESAPDSLADDITASSEIHRHKKRRLPEPATCSCVVF
ncbi:MAG: hypothetical protein ACYS8S_01200 [Planctomycetota bacterium]|jgi:anti-sigma factor RsiW